MAQNGPIIMIEDDIDDQQILQIVFEELGIENKIIFFESTSCAMNYLCATIDKPFIIFCDINLPEQDGLQFKKEIDKHPELRRKSVPFIFYSTSAYQAAVEKAYTEISVQGFFLKGHSLKEIKSMMKTIVDYWMLCRHPNS